MNGLITGATYCVAGFGLCMPAWLPLVADRMPEFLSQWAVPLASLVWLVTQIYFKWRGR